MSDYRPEDWIPKIIELLSIATVVGFLVGIHHIVPTCVNVAICEKVCGMYFQQRTLYILATFTCVAALAWMRNWYYLKNFCCTSTLIIILIGMILGICVFFMLGCHSCKCTKCTFANMEEQLRSSREHIT